MIKTYDIGNLTIGSKVFIVSKHYAFANKPGGKVLQGRIISFVNQKGELKVEFKITGHPRILNETYYKIFDNITDAINSIRS